MHGRGSNKEKAHHDYIYYIVVGDFFSHTHSSFATEYSIVGLITVGLLIFWGVLEAEGWMRLCVCYCI